MLAAGLALGFACSVKLWAASVAAAVMLVLAVRSRRALAVLTAGAASVFGAVCLPFFLAAPGAFISDVFLLQIQRHEGGRAPALYKLRKLTGADAVETVHVPDYLVIAVTAMFVVCVAYRIARRHRDLDACDWCVIAGVVAMTAAVFSTGQFYWTYSYLPFAWIAMTAGLLVALTPIVWVPPAALLVVVGVACAVAFAEDTRHARAEMNGSFGVADAVRDAVPP